MARMKVLVRLPNWLGDIIMSIAFIKKLKLWAPDAEIDIIIREEMVGMVSYLPGINNTYLFSKAAKSNLWLKYKFAQDIKRREDYDLFFSLPDSFSSAFIGYFSGAKKRIGYKNSLRNLLLTHSFSKPTDLHRVEEYIFLLKLFFKKYGSFNETLDLELAEIDNEIPENVPEEYMIFSAVSEATSRTIPLLMSVSLINHFIDEFNLPIVFIGAPSTEEYYSELIDRIEKRSFCINLAGRTSLANLIPVMNNSKVIVSTDSGTAHLANALNKKLLVLFGAGNEFNTGPYNKGNSQIIRTSFECTPCVSNKCKYGLPKCLLALEVGDIVNRIRNLIGSKITQET